MIKRTFNYTADPLTILADLNRLTSDIVKKPLMVTIEINGCDVVISSRHIARYKPARDPASI